MSKPETIVEQKKVTVEISEATLPKGTSTALLLTRLKKIPPSSTIRRNRDLEFSEEKDGLPLLATRRNLSLYFFSAVLYQLSYLATARCG